ncbi:MAG: hypothetical protein K2M42_06160 [Oscillospiraceae bacterium]|nr:hypothetical protein [Oscillospiraceae bacterium]
MKKVLKMIGAVLLIAIIAVIGVLVYVGNRPAALTDYQQSVETGGEIEAKYMSNGEFEVSVYEEQALQVFKKYVIYYPAELETSDKQYPVIVICNGSGTPISKYPAVPEHYASWGFIVIGTEEENAWNGFGAEMSIRHLQRLNDNEQIEAGKTNIFYQKVDLSNVGIVGHSQGGVGVLNAITAQTHKDIYKAAVSLSPTNKEMAHGLEWDYDATLVDIPIMLISGAGGGDDWVVTGEQLESIYNDVADNKIMMRRNDTPHGEVLYSEDGYVTAWFMWQLQGDQNAAKAFVGDHAEILINPLYQDQQIAIK